MRGHARSREILTVEYRADAPGLALHRASLFQVLWDAAIAAGATLATGAAVVAAPQAGTLRWLEREGGLRLGPFDLVIGASGTGSRLSPMVARALPFGAVWASVPWPAGADLPQDQLSQRYFRAKKMAGVLPIGRLPDDPTPCAALFWSLPVAGLDRWPEVRFGQWRDEVGRFWPEMVPFLAQLRGKADLTPAHYTHGSVGKVDQPGLVFVGDAAYRASPQLGQGANMALLDAMALALALDACPLAQALPRYAAMRRWHCGFYQALSASFTPMYQSDSRLLPVLRDWVLAPAGRMPPVDRILTTLVSGDLLPPLASPRFP